MSDGYEHNPGDHEDPLAGPTWTVAVIGAALLVVSILGVTALMNRVVDEEQDQKVFEPLVNRAMPELEQLRAEQLARLVGPPRRELRPENLDGEESLVIPLETAMNLYVQEARGRRP